MLLNCLEPVSSSWVLLSRRVRAAFNTRLTAVPFKRSIDHSRNAAGGHGHCSRPSVSGPLTLTRGHFPAPRSFLEFTCQHQYFHGPLELCPPGPAARRLRPTFSSTSSFQALAGSPCSPPRKACKLRWGPPRLFSFVSPLCGVLSFDA